MMRSDELSVYLPASIVADSSDLKEKTLKVGRIGRVAAIFRVENIFIYKDNDEKVGNQDKESNLVKTLLDYIETPQYLRKSLFPFMEELRFAGLLPPLRTPHHPLRDERNNEGDFREAVVLKDKGDESVLNLGLSEEGITNGGLEEGSRVTVRLGEKISDGRRIVHLAKEENINDYWGFKVSVKGELAQSLSKERVEYSIGTSRYGQNLYEVVEGIKNNTGEKMAVTFGGPYAGLFEICKRQEVDVDDLFDVVLNVVPDQGTSTVRTEEALTSTLSILNIMLRRK